MYAKCIFVAAAIMIFLAPALPEYGMELAPPNDLHERQVMPLVIPKNYTFKAGRVQFSLHGTLLCDNTMLYGVLSSDLLTVKILTLREHFMDLEQANDTTRIAIAQHAWNVPWEDREQGLCDKREPGGTMRGLKGEGRELSAVDPNDILWWIVTISFYLTNFATAYIIFFGGMTGTANYAKKHGYTENQERALNAVIVGLLQMSGPILTDLANRLRRAPVMRPRRGCGSHGRRTSQYKHDTQEQSICAYRTVDRKRPLWGSRPCRVVTSRYTGRGNDMPNTPINSRRSGVHR